MSLSPGCLPDASPTSAKRINETERKPPTLPQTPKTTSFGSLKANGGP